MRFSKQLAQVGLFLVCTIVPGVYAAGTTLPPSDSTVQLQVFFPRGMSAVDTTFHDNGKNISHFITIINELATEPAVVLRTLVIRGSASPDGNTAYNENLSRSRARSIYRYLQEQSGWDSSLFRIESVGEDWEGLREAVAALDSTLTWRSGVLDIIDNTPVWVVQGGKVVDGRKRQLRMYDDGSAWAHMEQEIFPELRSAGGRVQAIFQREVRDTVYIKTHQVDTVFVDRTPVATPTVDTEVQPETKKKKKLDRSDHKFIMAFRTNILAIPLVNVGMEIPLGRHWSLEGDYYYPWLPRNNVHDRCFQALALDLGARYWFRKPKDTSRLLGHSLGMYVAGGYYDFEWNWNGHQGEFVNVGVDYLYAVPIFGGRMHMEFELGLGYIFSAARPYECFFAGDKCYRKPGGITKHVNWFGPTRAQISLVVPIYVRQKSGKGGKR